MKTIFATAFGRVVDIQRNKSDPLVEAGATIFGTYDSSSGESLILFLCLCVSYQTMHPVMKILLNPTIFLFQPP